jgi:ABC-type branched-subunit amino acid transport system substrate-binding protein
MQVRGWVARSDTRVGWRGILGMRANRTICIVLGFTGASAFVGCNSIIGLDQFEISQTGGAGGRGGTAGTGGASGGGGTGGNNFDGGTDARVAECQTNQECTDRATAAAMALFQEAGPPDGSDGGPPGIVPAMCVQSIGKCVELLSVDCQTITGDYLNDDAILLGTLFSTIGAQGATNLQRQRSATLAFEEINTKGGLPPHTTGGSRRPIVAISCDEFTNPTRAATHLIDELHVPAIVGPNTSQDTINISQNISIKGGTVMMTPSAVASSIADLVDDDLTWLMAPSDVQRAPLMIKQINDLETQLKTDRSKTTIKFGIIYRDDALGQGTQKALIPLKINGASLTGQPSYVRIDGYQPTAPNQTTLVNNYVAFAPDIIALAGTAEAITAVMNPLEAAWNSEAGIERPYYVTIDSAKVPDLLASAANAAYPGLRSRVRGTGITPTTDAQLVLDTFKIAYQNRYGAQPTASSTGPSYDAAYAISYAITAIKNLPVTGKNIAAGLRQLAGGPTVIEVGSTKILAAFQKLTTGGDGGGEKISLIGTFSPLDWDMSGAPVSAKLEMWCIGATGTPAYGSSGLFYDLKTQQYSGMYTQCP